MPDFNADPSSSDEEGSIDDWNPRLQRRKACTAAAAQADPLWDAVQKNLPVAAQDQASAEYGCIVPMIQVAQNKHRVWCTPLEEYLLAEWTEWHRVVMVIMIGLIRVLLAVSALVHILLAISTLIHIHLPASTAICAHSIIVAPLPMIIVTPLPMIPLSRDRHPPSSSHRHSCSPGSDLAGSRGHPVSRMPEPSGSWHAQRSRSASHGPTKVVDSFEAPQTPPGRPSAPPVIPGDSFEALQPPPDRPSAPPVVPSDSFEAPQTPPGHPSTLSTFPGAAADPATTEPIATDLAVVNPVGVDPAVIDPAVIDQAVVDQAVIDPVVPLATWFRIELSGVTEDVDIPRLFELFQATGLIGVRVRKNKMAKGAARNKKKVLLSFKSEQRRDAVLSLLRNSPEHRPWPFNEANTVHVDRQEALDSFRYVLCPEYVQMCYLHQQSPVDLAEMMENAPPYRDLGDLRRFHPFPLPVAATSVKTFLRYSLLELNRYPPIAVEGFTLGAPQIMDRIEFTTAWLVRTLDEEYTATRRRLAQFVRAHAIRDDRSTTPFWVPLYRTNGPYDDLVRVIGQSAMLDPDVQYSRPSRPRHMESFGYLESGLWYIDWDRLASLFQQSSQLNELLLAPPAHTASWEVPGFLGPLGLCDWEQRSFRKHQLPSFSSRVSTLTSAYRHFHPIYTSRSFLIPTPLDSLIITIFVLHHTLIIDSTLRGGRSTAIFLLGTFLKYLDVAVGKIAPLDPMANKSVPASSKANLKTYQGRLVRRNSTNGASDEEAPKTKVSKLPTRATKRKVIDSSSEEPTSSDADRALKTRTHKEVEPPPRRTIKHFAVMGASRNETYEALNVTPAAERLAISKSSDGHTSSNDKELPKSGKSGPPGGKQAKSNYRIVGGLSPLKPSRPNIIFRLPIIFHLPNIAGPELINLEIRPHSPVSDTPSTLLEEARRISDPRKILDDAQELAHHLHPSIHVAHPGDFLNVWDADALDNILLALPNEGADPLDDYEYVDWLAFFADKQGLNLEQFEIKILKLLKVLRRCPLVPSGPSPMHTLDLAWPAAPTALVPKVPRVGNDFCQPNSAPCEMSINGPQSDSDNGGSSDIDDDVDVIGEEDDEN
ncbi:hypothetical protein BS47DRAFT_1400326 [Hydnum rufescens UP504]|uniref:Uncharacterized protein n=1 Tax=Hydnum rufescens UP504 TaxID=1448309 RepID=A0A9P6DJ67_9AGAM|nr:hypothetical protein BS47DRAFT_1400326 [Hydnum rufescens UP504]